MIRIIDEEFLTLHLKNIINRQVKVCFPLLLFHLFFPLENICSISLKYQPSKRKYLQEFNKGRSKIHQKNVTWKYLNFWVLLKVLKVPKYPKCPSACVPKRPRVLSAQAPKWPKYSSAWVPSECNLSAQVSDFPPIAV